MKGGSAMDRLQVSGNCRYLLRDGKPFFWLGDTCWSAFTNIPDEDWLVYLQERAALGFNVLQINALPQWDRCGSELNRYPFPEKGDGRFDFGRILPEYFEHAHWMCQKAQEQGFTLMLVLMWCNYVPDTWASHICADNVMPEDRVEPVIQKICETFQEFHPVYAISGDTGFESEQTRKRYRLVADLADKYAPQELKAYHIRGRYDGLPQEFAERADIYLYQSGHNAGAQDMSHKLAGIFAGRTPRRPVINSEPCYEQMGYSHHTYGRFHREEIRSALWNSLLAGASAGITYGAHGIWNWYRPGMPVNPIGGEGFLRAMPADKALHFPGAADYAYAARLFREREITQMVPCQEILGDYREHIRAARTEKEIFLYVPVTVPLVLNGDYSGYQATAVDLDTYACSRLKMQCKDASAQVPMHSFYKDALLILEKV